MIEKYPNLIKSPEELFAIGTKRGLTEKFCYEFVSINFVDSIERNLILQNKNKLNEIKNQKPASVGKNFM